MSDVKFYLMTVFAGGWADAFSRGFKARGGDCRDGAIQLGADKADVTAEIVELISEGGGYFHFVDGMLNVVKAGDQFLAAFRGQRDEGFALKGEQGAVAAVDDHADAPFIERGDGAHHGNDDDDQWHERNEDAVHETREPEGQGTVEKTFAGFVEAVGVRADGVIVFQRGGEFAFVLEEPGVAVDFLGGFEQEVGQGGMQIGAGEDFGGGADQIQVLRGNVFAEINRTHGHLEFIEIGNAAGVAVGLGEIENPDAGGEQELFHDEWRGGIAHQEHGVDGAIGQGAGGCCGIEVEQVGGVVGGETVQLEQGQGEGTGAAADGADGEAFAVQLREPIQSIGRAIENEQRLVGDAAKRHERAIGDEGTGADLDETDIDFLTGVVEAFEIFRGAFGGQDFEFNAFAGEDCGVLFGVGLEGAAGRAAGNGNGGGRCGMEKPEDGERQQQRGGKKDEKRERRAETKGLGQGR